MGYYIKRTNVSADNDVTFIGKRFQCGMSAEAYETISSAESSLKRQKQQDMELCPDCLIRYEIVKKD